jgi:multidrug efflux pump subunit AcrA (membrane-fusion protein)
MSGAESGALQTALSISQQQHAAAVAELAEARADLQRDEEIFARRNDELRRLSRAVRELTAERDALAQRLGATDTAAAPGLYHAPVLAITSPSSTATGGGMNFDGHGVAASAVVSESGGDEMQSPQRLAAQARRPILQDESVLLGSPTGHHPSPLRSDVSPIFGDASHGFVTAPSDAELRTPQPAHRHPIRQPVPVLLAPPPPTAGGSGEMTGRDMHASVTEDAVTSEHDRIVLEEREQYALCVEGMI